MKKNWVNWAILSVICVGLGSLITLTVHLTAIPDSGPVVAAPSTPPKVKAPPEGTTTNVVRDGLEGEVTKVGGRTYFKVTKFNPRKKSGTLTFIASQFDTSVGQLVAWNGIDNPNLIHVGQKLRVA